MDTCKFHPGRSIAASSTVLHFGLCSDCLLIWLRHTPPWGYNGRSSLSGKSAMHRPCDWRRYNEQAYWDTKYLVSKSY